MSDRKVRGGLAIRMSPRRPLLRRNPSKLPNPITLTPVPSPKKGTVGLSVLEAASRLEHLPGKDIGQVVECIRPILHGPGPALAGLQEGEMKNLLDRTGGLDPRPGPR